MVKLPEYDPSKVTNFVLVCFLQLRINKVNQAYFSLSARNRADQWSSDRASTTKTVDSGSIPGGVKPKTK